MQMQVLLGRTNTNTGSQRSRQNVVGPTTQRQSGTFGENTKSGLAGDTKSGAPC